MLYVRFPLTSTSQAGTIVQQSPSAGAPANAQVLVFLGAYRRGSRATSRGVSSSSLGSSVCVEIPTIASPRPAETRASTSASR